MSDRVLTPWSVLSRHLNAFGAVFLLLGICSFIWGAVVWSDGRQLAREGIWTTAVVVSQRVNTNPETGARTYRVRYRFTVADGQEVTGSVTVNRARYSSLRTGRTLRVRYALSNPGNNAPDFESRASWGLFLMLFGGVSTVLSLALLWRQKPELEAMLRAAKAPGRPARVTGHRPLHARIGKARRLRLEWRDDAGKTGITGIVENKDAPSLNALITLHTDPRTGQSFWDGDLADPHRPE